MTFGQYRSAAVAGATGGAKGVIDDAGKKMSAEGTQVGGKIQKIVGNLNSALSEGEKMQKGGATAGAQGVLRSFQSDLARLAFISALQQAMNKAGGGGPFNLETAINDLWIALDGVKRGQKAASASMQMQQADQILQSMNSMLKTMHEATMSAARNIR